MVGCIWGRPEGPNCNSPDRQVGATHPRHRGPKGRYDHVGPSDLGNNSCTLTPDLTVGVTMFKNRGGPKERNDQRPFGPQLCSCGNVTPDLTVGAISGRRFAP
jgi:hypothetical protein